MSVSNEDSRVGSMLDKAEKPTQGPNTETVEDQRMEKAVEETGTRTVTHPGIVKVAFSPRDICGTN